VGDHVDMAHEQWSAAEQYEPFMGRWSRLLAGVALEWLDPPAGLRWLDVGCGTGAVSAAVLAKAAPSSLLGIDPSESYVAAASRLDGATFQVGDASALPVPEASVDRVIAGLVLNFVPDAVTAVREMRRVLVPGGRAAAYVWDHATGMQMLRRFWDAAVAEDATAAALDEGARFAICQAGGLQQCFTEAGLRDIEAQPIEIATVFRDFDDYWLPFLGGQGPAPNYVAGLSQDAREGLRARLQATLPTEPDGSIRLTARAWAASGALR
jgi:SAM-dependent methyltransferase